jgi:hypothetical protein
MRSTACRCRCSRRRSRFPPRKKLVPRPSTARSFYFASGGQDRPQLSNLSRLFTGRDRSNFAQIAEHCGRRRALVAASPGRRSVNDRQIGRRAARACAMPNSCCIAGGRRFAHNSRQVLLSSAQFAACPTPIIFRGGIEIIKNHPKIICAAATGENRPESVN